MDILIENVDWIAVIVGTVIAFGAGAIWYSQKVFGRKWAEGVGLSMDGDAGSMGMAMVAQAVATFLLAWVVGVIETSGSFVLAILVAVTIASLMKAGGLFIKKSRYAIAVDSGFVLVMVLIMIGVHMVL